MPAVYTYVGVKFNRFFIILGGTGFVDRNFQDFKNRSKIANFGNLRVKSRDFHSLRDYNRNFIISWIIAKFNKFVISDKLDNFKREIT